MRTSDLVAAVAALQKAELVAIARAVADERRSGQWPRTDRSGCPTNPPTKWRRAEDSDRVLADRLSPEGEVARQSNYRRSGLGL